MPRAGHHAIEMVLKGLFHDKFAYCEFYTIPGCCKMIPCARAAEYAAAGALVFMQKTHDHNLTDPIPASVDGILVQVREPVARALSNYELDVVKLGPRHSPAYLQFSLGMEAAYSNAFFKKWCALKNDDRVLVVRYEDLVRDPPAYFSSVFSKFSLPESYFDEAAINRMQGKSSGGNFKFKLRDPLHSKYYDEGYFRQYSALVGPPASLGGYEDHAVEPSSSGSSAINLSYVAFGALYSGNYLRALDAFTAYLALTDAHFCGLFHRSLVYRRLGKNAEAERDLRRLLEIDDSFEAAYFALAELQDSDSGRRAQETLTRCLARSPDAAKTHERMRLRFARRPQLIPDYTPPASPILAKEDVITAFRFILGREPASESVVKAHQAAGSIEALRTILIKSAEFRSIYEKITRAK
jgi:tetratricopeptide (TPR) repeat protein